MVVVVHEMDQFPRREARSEIARPSRSAAGGRSVADIGDAGIPKRIDDRLRRTLGGVVHDDQFESDPVLAQNAAKRFVELGRSAACWYDDRNVRI
jgi:hypothetical protein